ncbi:MAG: TIGR01244 family sulfur transferase [Rhodanobacter sp.]
MQLHKLTEQLSVAAQISPEDMADLAAAGFRSVINNRPDGEARDQPASALLAATAAEHGLDYRYLPVVPGQLSDEAAADFADALRNLPAPVLAFCRTGTRSTSIWALQAAGDADAILGVARQAGYDLASLRPRLLARTGR